MTTYHRHQEARENNQSSWIGLFSVCSHLPKIVGLNALKTNLSPKSKSLDCKKRRRDKTTTTIMQQIRLVMYFYWHKHYSKRLVCPLHAYSRTRCQVSFSEPLVWFKNEPQCGKTNNVDLQSARECTLQSSGSLLLTVLRQGFWCGSYFMLIWVGISCSFVFYC